MTDTAEQRFKISLVKVYLRDDTMSPFPEPNGVSFHDGMCHISWLTDGDGYNIFFPLDTIARVEIVERPITLMSPGLTVVHQGDH